MSTIGWQAHPSAPGVDPDVLAELRTVATSLLSDSMSRVSGSVGLRPFHRSRRMAGTAVTVRTRPGDNLAIYRAFPVCRPGDVLVVDGGGDTHQGLMGEIMTTYADSLGMDGVVIDGAVRDLGAIRERDFPVYARAFTHRGPWKTGPGEINVPVEVGGMVVNPGDVVVGDENGVLAIPPAQVSEVLTAAREKGRSEAAELEGIAAGELDLSWVDEHTRRMQQT